MSDVRQRIDESWQEWLETLDGVPENRMTEPGAAGEWSIKDLMAHVAFWDDTAADAADARGAGKTPEQFDWREANDREAALRADWTLAQSRAAMDAAHQRVLDALARYPELGPKFWESSTYEHYQEHVADIRAWREKKCV
jgi:hypothetical protein